MAFTYDTTTSAADDVAGTSQTMSHTCSVDADLLIVSVFIDSSVDQITGVTYNGVAMTDLGFRATSGEGFAMYGLFSPASGANNVVASFSASRKSAIIASSFVGAKTTGSMPDSFTSAYDAADVSPTTFSTTAVANSGLSYLTVLFTFSPSVTISFGAGGTKLGQLDVDSGNSFMAFGWEPFTSAGSTSMDVSGWGLSANPVGGAMVTFEQEGTKFVPRVIFI